MPIYVCKAMVFFQQEQKPGPDEPVSGGRGSKDDDRPCHVIGSALRLYEVPDKDRMLQNGSILTHNSLWYAIDNP
jgi:hypothetical protein